MKKFLALVLALVMTMSLVTISAGAKDFDDAADITYTEAVDVMSALKVVDGDTAGNFNPTAGLTRGAAAKIICNLILGPATAAALNADTNPYVDVAEDSVFAGYIAYCAKEGIVSGYADGTFKPAAPLTGYAFLKMLLGALGYDAAVEGYTGANWFINVAKQALGITKNNKLNVTNTDNGVLTQVFVDNDKEEVVVTMINTYLAQAVIDYSAKKDMVTYKVYTTDGKYVNYDVSGEDFDIADVAKDDFALVTVADKAIQTIADVEVIADTEIEKFSTGSSLTVDGEKYSYSKMAEYKEAVLAQYTEKGVVTNLKDTTYNVYVDAYGYVIGVDIVSTPDDYLFVTGYDTARSNLANKNWDVNVIFMDGTSAVVKVKDAGKAFEGIDNGKQVNAWFKFTVNSSDVYSLKPVESKQITNVAKTATTQSTDDMTAQIDAKHISLKGNSETVYGNASTIYLLADLDKVDGTDVIVGADEVVTGVKNAAFEMAAAPAGLHKAYPLYKNTGYVIAAVVVGESATVASDIAYFLNTGVDSESYNKTTGMWTWTRTAIINGEKVVLKEVNDTGVSYLEGGVVKEGDVNKTTNWGFQWVEVKYDANGNVKKVEPADFETSMAAAAAELKTEDVVLVDTGDTDNDQFELKGNTMYDTTSAA